jgi:hypothetical protein
LLLEIDRNQVRLNHFERDNDITSSGLAIRTRLVRCVHKGLRDFMIQPRQADAEARLKKIGVAGCAQVYFGVNGCTGRHNDLHFPGLELHRTKKAR